MINTEFKSIKDILEKEKEERIKVISLFAGGGGSSMGYRMAGAKVIAINEFVEIAQKTYKANFPNTYIFKEDIRELSGDKILQTLNIDKYELDLLDGSPPCSAFSTAGLLTKGWQKEKKYSDNKCQIVDDLFLEYIRILRDLKPKTFVAENVKGLTIGKSKGYLNLILRELRKSGYYVEAKILNSKNYGVPQSRERLFFIGVREDLFKEEYKNKLHPKPTIKRIIPLKYYFEYYKDYIIDDFRFCIKSEKRLKLWRLTPPGKSFEIAHNKLYGKKSYFTHRKINSNLISHTLTTHQDSYSDKAPRWLYIPELTIIAGVPIDYINLGTKEQQIERLGRMVTPPVTKAITDNLINLGIFK